MPANAVSRVRGAPARLVIADDHDLARLGLVGALQGERGLTVVGEARDGQEAVDLCRSLAPDLILMDIRMPRLDGLAATDEIVRTCPGTRVVMVTMQEDPEYLIEALKVGASGYLLKESGKAEIVGAIRQVLAGESLLNARLVTELLHRMDREGGTLPEPPAHALSERELDVLRLMVAGRTNREIAQELILSVSTVKTHVEHVIAKLEVADRTQAAVKATRLGIVKPSSV
jgi:DNA-binding NarL/FixJ family response regulator